MEKVEQTGQESFSAISVNNTPTRKPSSSYESNFKIQPVAAIGVGLPLVAGGGLLARLWEHLVERVDPELSSVRGVSGMRPSQLTLRQQVPYV